MEKLISQQWVRIVWRRERLWYRETSEEQPRQWIMRASIRVVKMGMESKDEVTEILQRYWQDLANYEWWWETEVRHKRFHVCVRTWVNTINWIRRKDGFGVFGGKVVSWVLEPVHTSSCCAWRIAIQEAMAAVTSRVKVSEGKCSSFCLQAPRTAVKFWSWGGS